MSTGGRIWVVVLRAIAGALQGGGADVGRVFREAGVDPAILDEPDGRLAAGPTFRLWTVAARALGDPALGLHAAEGLELDRLDVLGAALRSSPTLGEAWRRLARFHRYVFPGMSFRVDVSGDEAALVYAGPARDAFPPLVIEHILAGLVVLGRQCTGVDWSPVRVRFGFPRPAEIHEHERILRCPVVFDAADDAVVVPTRLLDLPQAEGRPAVASVIDRYLDDLLERLPEGAGIQGDVRSAIGRDLFGADVSVDAVAQRLGLSARTLQRRLADEGTTFQAVVDAAKRELACWHLERARLSVTEVAYTLGFSEPSAFHRAFRRWTGRTPGEWRESARAAPSDA